MSTASPALHTASLSGRPETRSLLRWGALVLLLHLLVLLSLTGTLNWQLSPSQTLRTGPMQTRTIASPAAELMASEPNPTPAARTRVALVEKPKPATTQKPTTPTTVTAPKKPPTVATIETASPAEPAQLISSPPEEKSAPATHLNAEHGTDNPLAAAAGPQTSGTLLAEATVPKTSTESPSLSPASPDTAPSAPTLGAATPSTQDPTHNPTPLPSGEPQISNSTAPSRAPANSPRPIPAEPASLGLTLPTATSDAAVKTATPERIASATLALPVLALASLPPSALLSYSLSGQEKGINYQASGELRWQRNDNAYAMSLSVKAFLLGSRHWRSVGQINTTGLAPTRFSDSWRSERAAHFDRPNQRIVFSNNAPTVPLQPGAQDQVSLYVQLAAAMAQSGQRMPPGTRLQIQTATVRDALPWLLTLDKLETLQLDGQSLQTVKWVCQPRNRFDAQVEFWVSAAHDWLPARIRITQVSGSFIDLQLTGREALPDLSPMQ